MAKATGNYDYYHGVGETGDVLTKNYVGAKVRVFEPFNDENDVTHFALVVRDSSDSLIETLSGQSIQKTEGKVSGTYDEVTRKNVNNESIFKHLVTIESGPFYGWTVDPTG